MTDIEKIIEEIKENCRIIGNNSLLAILEEESDIKDLYKKIRRYNSELTLQEEIIEEGESKPKYLIYIYNTCFDPNNIGRVELSQEYNNITFKVNFSIIIYPKYSKGVEGEEVCINFKDELERDYYFDILKIKLKRTLDINVF